LDGGFLSVGQIPGSASLAYPYIRFDSIAVTSSSLLFTASNMLGTHCVLGRMSKAGGGIAIIRASTDCLMYVATKGDSVYLATNYDRSTKEKSRVELIEPSSSTPSFALTAVARTRLSNISVSDAVYVVADGDYFRVPLQGGVLSRLGWWPSTELVAGQNAFFLGGGRTISGVPVGSTTAQTLVSDRSNVSGIASDGTNLYWTENSEHPQLRDTRVITIYRGSIAGGSIQKVGNVPTPPSASSGMELRLAIDGTTAYAALNTQIYKQPLTF
jgi:hypothetical protein